MLYFLQGSGTEAGKLEAVRKDILPYVALTCLQTEKFKTSCLSVTLLTQLNRETAAKNALIPFVLRRGCASHPDMESLSAYLDGLYGARVEPVVRKKGEIQCVGFVASFCEERYLPERMGLLDRVSALLGELLLSPNTRGGLFLPSYVDSERDKLIERIDASVNEKRSYSLRRLLELMCPFEDYATDRFGTREEAEAVSYTKLTRCYRELLQRAPLEIFYCGGAEPEAVERAMKSALLTLPRGEPDRELGTDIRMNALEEPPRTFTEELDVTQGKLAVGFRLGECMEEPDQAALRVFNAVYGGSVTSKLFMNVRERLSLCYFASSSLDRHKGIMTVSSGIEFDKYDEALREILAQLDTIGEGHVTESELTAARKFIASDLRSDTDSPGALEDFYLSQAIDGLSYGPMELAALAEGVTLDDIVKIARGVECDAVYFLRGKTEGEAEQDD
jgi:predicted Zn-dependent peptidase